MNKTRIMSKLERFNARGQRVPAGDYVRRADAKKVFQTGCKIFRSIVPTLQSKYALDEEKAARLAESIEAAMEPWAKFK